VLLVEVDIDVVLEVVVGRPVGIEMPLGSENGFAGVVVGRPVGIVTPLGRENEFGELPTTIDKPWG
jgi:hypothetical protein